MYINISARHGALRSTIYYFVCLFGATYQQPNDNVYATTYIARAQNAILDIRGMNYMYINVFSHTMHEKISRPFRIMNIRTPFIVHHTPIQIQPGRCQDKNRKSQPFTPTVCDGIRICAAVSKADSAFLPARILDNLSGSHSVALILSLYRFARSAKRHAYTKYICISSYEKIHFGYFVQTKALRVKLTKLTAHAGSRLFLLFNATRHRASAVMIIFNK